MLSKGNGSWRWRIWWKSNCELSGQKTSRYQGSLAPRDSFVRPGRTTHALGYHTNLPDFSRMRKLSRDKTTHSLRYVFPFRTNNNNNKPFPSSASHVMNSFQRQLTILFSQILFLWEENSNTNSSLWGSGTGLCQMVVSPFLAWNMCVASYSPGDKTQTSSTFHKAFCDTSTSVSSNVE